MMTMVKQYWIFSVVGCLATSLFFWLTEAHRPVALLAGPFLFLLFPLPIGVALTIRERRVRTK